MAKKRVYKATRAYKAMAKKRAYKAMAKMAKKRVYKATVREYEIKVRDYGYTSRAPIGVLVSGTRLGECVNLFGEPCYFYASHDAYSMEEGIKLAYQIIDKQTDRQPGLTGNH